MRFFLKQLGVILSVPLLAAAIAFFAVGNAYVGFLLIGAFILSTGYAAIN